MEFMKLWIINKFICSLCKSYATEMVFIEFYKRLISHRLLAGWFPFDMLFNPSPQPHYFK